MKRFLAVILLAVTVIGYYWFASQRDAAPQVPLRYSDAKLTVLNAAVYLNDTLVEDVAEITAGAQIRTDSTGRALLHSGPQLITSVAPSTELVFALETDLSRVEVLSGRAWSRLERALEQDERYEVYTPTLVAAVRGTSFGVMVSDREEKFIVGEGIIGVTKRSESGETVQVMAGNTLTLGSDGSFLITPTTDSERDAWYQEHINNSWEYGGSDTLEATKVHRDGFWFANPGQVTIEGIGFNQLRSVTVDGSPLAFVLESDRVLRVPWVALLGVRDDSDVTIYYEGGTITPDAVYVGSYEEAVKNLIPFY